MRIADLIQGLDITIAGGDADAALGNLRVCDVTEDSRTVMPGSLFVARTGEKSDGKAFVGPAVEAGAVAVLVDDPGFAWPTGGPGKSPSRSVGVPGDSPPRSVGVPGRVALLRCDDIDGATARLAERFYGNPSSKMAMIGVTGTNGKTTITFLIHQMLNALGIRCGLIGTVVIDDGVEIAPASLTTPPALEVSRTLARMLEAGCRAAVMEVSSHALDQQRVGAPGGVRFNAGVFTNLTGDHLDYHGTMEDYAAAKRRLFEGLPAEGVAVVNIQDAAHSQMVGGCKASIIRCAVEGARGPLGDRLPPPPVGTGDSSATEGGTGGSSASGARGTSSIQPGLPPPPTLCRARVLGSNTSGTDVEFTGPWGHRTVRVPLVGAFNVMNALQAVSTVHALFGGTDEDAVSFEIIAGALEKASAPPGRLEPVTAPGAPIQVFVDYAHTDDALATVLKVLRGAMKAPAVPTSDLDPTSSRLWCVFGCGGDRDRTKRPRMGKVAAELADWVIVTSDNPRTEDPTAIIDEVMAGVREVVGPPGSLFRGATSNTWMTEPDRGAAIRIAIQMAMPGDTVIIAGKGHEDYQIIGTQKRHFDDREVARGALRERGMAVRE